MRAVHGAAPPRLHVANQACSTPSRIREHQLSGSDRRSPTICAGRQPFPSTSRSASTEPPTRSRRPSRLRTTPSTSSPASATAWHRGRLQGLVHVGGKWRWKTSFASAYPPLLARSYAAVAESVAPRSAWRNHGSRKLDPRWEAMAAAFHSRQANT